jgi:hypothetical protein
MATQRYISTSFWDDPWIRKLTKDERYLYLYFLTNPLTNIAGIYQIGIDRIAFDTGFTEKEALDIIKRFEEAGKAYYYHEEFMVLPTWPKHQKWEKHSKINAGIKACIEKLNPDLVSFLKYIGYRYPMDSLSIAYTDDTDRVSIPYGYPRNYSDTDIDIDLDIDPDIDTNAETAKKLSSHFIQRWQQNADVFNCLAGLKRPKDWNAFWERNTMTMKQIDLAIDNFIAGVKSGAIERRFVPSSPDGFVINGWLQRSAEPFKKQGQSQRIANDSEADDIGKYFREA